MTDTDGSTRGRSFTRRVTTTLVAWIAAYAVVTVVVAVGGSALAGAPRAVQTLVVSGTLVVVMVNLVMPAVGGLLGRLFAGRRP